MKVFSRKSKLENKIKDELTKNKPKLENIIRFVDEYSKASEDTIEKLKKGKTFNAKRINGALRQTINAHGPITKQLIGSASKRILGAVIDEKPKSSTNKIGIIGFTLNVILIIIIVFLILNK